MIGRAVEPAFARHKVGKHFVVTIAENMCTWIRNVERIRQEAESDGFYVIFAKMPDPQPTASELVAT